MKLATSCITLLILSLTLITLSENMRFSRGILFSSYRRVFNKLKNLLIICIIEKYLNFYED